MVFYSYLVFHLPGAVQRRCFKLNLVFCNIVLSATFRSKLCLQSCKFELRTPLETLQKLIRNKISVAPDFSGTEITTLGVTMSLTWRKRIHVTYELVTDLPIEPYSAQKMPKVKVC